MFASLLALSSLALAYADWASIRSAILEKSGQKSTSLRPLVAPAPEPAVPEGYFLAFGPLAAASSAPGYMGFVFLPSYDVAACASTCNTRDFDQVGGRCQFFNVWEAVVTSTNETTFTCAMYYLSTDASTATNTGDATISISAARGYSRISAVPNGNFEGFTCTAPAVTCSAASFGGWVGTSDNATVLDTAAIVRDPALAHFGSGSISLGSLSGKTAASGTMTFKNIPTVKGRSYDLGFFHSSLVRNAANATGAIVNVTWNGAAIETITGASNWTFHGRTLVAAGNDTLAFHGGKYPAYSSIDDVFLFLL
ncbi:hypothetical protein V5O48_009221 [Marasmius crinis-equi]|uniref:Uncharacterized protein n=1 Tax=Marasmius crinis-equi TaxID=585013 RepID=A0ABR3FBT8_9AGAR